MTSRAFLLALILAMMSGAAPSAQAADVKVLTAGAFKQVLLAVAPQYEQQTGNKLIIDNDTNGALVRRIEAGEAFDVAVLGPAAIDMLASKGKIRSGSRTDLAKVGIGVVVREGAPQPDIATVEAFKRALRAASSVAYVDPAGGGSSGIYIAVLIERLGLADEVKAKAKLIPGGAVAEHVARGEAEIGLHQISEILPVKGVSLVGPLPRDIQHYTVYAAGLSGTGNEAAGSALIKLLAGPEGIAALSAKGMEPPTK